MPQVRIMVRTDENPSDEEVARRLNEYLKTKRCPSCGGDLKYFDDCNVGWELTCPKCHWSCGVDR